MMTKMKWISGIGLEVETCLKYTNFSDRTVYEIKYDSSISSDYYTAKEVTSKILRNFKEIRHFFSVIRKNYYEKGINDSMGFHIHLSFKNQLCYNLIFSRDFTEKFLKFIFTKFPEVQKRNDNSYCKSYYENAYFFRNEGNTRYKAVNITEAFQRHKTIEFRIFPSTTTKRMYEYVKATIWFVEKYLDKHMRKFFIFAEEEKEDEDKEVRENVQGVCFV